MVRPRNSAGSSDCPGPSHARGCRSIGGRLSGEDVAESLQGRWRSQMLTIEATESAKSLETVGRILDAALAHRVDRGGVLVSVGGGITGDLVGCARCACVGLRSCMYLPRCWPWWMLPSGERPEPTVHCLTAVWEKSSWCVLATLLCIGRRGDPLFTPDRERRCGLAGPEARSSPRS